MAMSAFPLCKYNGWKTFITDYQWESCYHVYPCHCGLDQVFAADAADVNAVNCLFENSSFDLLYLDFGRGSSDKFFAHDNYLDVFPVVHPFPQPTSRVFVRCHVQAAPLSPQRFHSLFFAACFHVALQDEFHAD
ncbi:hypothetical protein RirG_148110 [Rhizophagus irregularis DAOM 197198w]|uniref:Uncharacterized protein n=1 Tax=Rhizophagus irregularis (strain DAOM 197198w) TaxID=1432141 RepID=A0A015K8R8_RHIIW|nr:hypothetical protein RirG_148110 [Rhizophagus irregularis DAOM 197198w]